MNFVAMVKSARLQLWTLAPAWGRSGRQTELGDQHYLPFYFPPPDRREAEPRERKGNLPRAIEREDMDKNLETLTRSRFPAYDELLRENA